MRHVVILFNDDVVQEFDLNPTTGDDAELVEGCFFIVEGSNNYIYPVRTIKMISNTVKD